MSNTYSILAAFSMSDMEQLKYAQFGRGRDRKKRKGRGGLIGTTLAGNAVRAGGALAGGAAVYYGGKRFLPQGAKDFIGQTAENTKNYVGSTATRAARRAKRRGFQAYGKTAKAVKGAYSTGRDYAGRAGGFIDGAATKIGRGAAQAVAYPYAWGGLGIKAAYDNPRITAGVLGAGALGGGAYAYNKNRKSKRDKTVAGKIQNARNYAAGIIRG